MKKLIITALLVCIVATAAAFALTACDQEEGVVRLTEVTHSVFYAPLYVAIEGGYFQEE